MAPAAQAAAVGTAAVTPSARAVRIASPISRGVSPPGSPHGEAAKALLSARVSVVCCRRGHAVASPRAGRGRALRARQPLEVVLHVGHLQDRP